MARRNKEMAKTARTVLPSKGSPTKTKRKTPNKDRKKKSQKGKDISSQKPNSTPNHTDNDIENNCNDPEKKKPEMQDEFYLQLETMSEEKLNNATLNELRDIALKWKDYHDDDIEVLIMPKHELLRIRKQNGCGRCPTIKRFAQYGTRFVLH